MTRRPHFQLSERPFSFFGSAAPDILARCVQWQLNKRQAGTPDRQGSPPRRPGARPRRGYSIRAPAAPVTALGPAVPQCARRWPLAFVRWCVSHEPAPLPKKVRVAAPSSACSAKAKDRRRRDPVGEIDSAPLQGSPDQGAGRSFSGSRAPHRNALIIDAARAQPGFPPYRRPVNIHPPNTRRAAELQASTF